MNIFRMNKPSPDPRSQFKLGIESKVVARPQRKAWSCVSIVCTPRACAAIQAFTKQRWLSADAPRLPLPACDAQQCECHYQHFDDRRSKPRRHADRNGLPRIYNAEERRSKGRGRRSTDL